MHELRELRVNRGMPIAIATESAGYPADETTSVASVR
jgi:hypothetical protein